MNLSSEEYVLTTNDCIFVLGDFQIDSCSSFYEQYVDILQGVVRVIRLRNNSTV